MFQLVRGEKEESGEWVGGIIAMPPDIKVFCD